MDESPEDHNFNQRHDGPFQVDKQERQAGHAHDGAEAQDVRHEEDRKLHSPESEATALTKTSSLPASTFPTQPNAEDARGSVRISKSQGEVPTVQQRRPSMPASNRRRSSRDFDVRKDGPFGRPSLTMTRRPSSTRSWQRQKSNGGVVPPDAVLDDEIGAVAGAEPPPPTVKQLQSSTDPAFEPEPPPLNYSLWDRRWSITFWWTVIVFDSVVEPIALYFGLWYGTDRSTLSANAVFSIITAALGGASILDYFLRLWRLWKKNSTCRVIGARRIYLDWFHWNFTLAWLIIMVELVVGSVQENPRQSPWLELLAVPLATMLYVFSTELLIVDVMRYFQMPAPCRISSIPKGAQLRPGIYSVIEDVCAVDGGGGTEYREALNRRYEASHIFRAMLRRLGVFWAVGGEVTAIVTTILICVLPYDPAYVVGWSLPFVWAGVWTLATIWYVKRELKKEKIAWTEEMAAKAQA